MELQNFECQIAKAQIARYVAGDALSDDAVGQLESHVAKCADCKKNLAERRAVLQAMLTPAGAANSAPERPSPKRAKFDLAESIRTRIQAKRPVQAVVQTETKPAAFTKPAMYSLALGAVLIGMSYASKNMGSMLGPKAETPTATVGKTSPVTTKPVSSHSIPASMPVVHKTSAVAKIKPKIQPPAKKAAEVTGDSEVPKPAQRHSRHHGTPRPTHDSVRVYEPEIQP